MNQIATNDAHSLKATNTLEAIEAWIAYERIEGLSEATLDTYERGLKIFADWVIENGKSPTASTLREFRFAMSEQYAAQTVNTWLSAVRSFFSFLVATERLPSNPASEIKSVKRSHSTRHKRDALTPAEVLSLLDTCEDSTLGIRDRAMITLMAYCALRIVEVHRANIDNLGSQSDRMVLEVWGKGRDEADELVIIPVSQEPVIRQWVSKRSLLRPKPDEIGDPLFLSLSNRTRGTRLSRRSISQVVRGKIREVGAVGKVSPHSLRHSAITQAIQGGARPMQVRALARHQSFETTLNYIHEAARTDDPAEDYIKYE